MGVLGNVLVQRVHELPAAALALVVAPQREPGGHVKVAGAARCRVGHDHLALVDRLGQVFPGFGLGDVLLLRFHGVEAHGRAPHVHAPPGRHLLLVAVLAHDGVEVQRRVGLEHAVLVEQGQAGCSHAHDSVGLRVGLFSQQLGGDDAGGVTHPLEFDVGVDLVEAFLVGLELIRFQRGIDQQLGFLGRGRSGHGQQAGQHQGFGNGGQAHQKLLQVKVAML